MRADFVKSAHKRQRNMSNTSKRLAKNTAFMYIRMFVLMVVSFYTSRIVLQQLGVEDYGIYNLVGSIVAMFNSLRVIFASSTQRYLNYEMGQSNEENLSFNACCTDGFGAGNHLHVR